MSSERLSNELPDLSVPDSQQEGSASDQNVHDSITFIDHSSYFNFESTVSETPLLDGIKKAYSALCLVRKSCEINGMTHQEMQVHRKNEKIVLRPAKYSDIMPYSNIFFVGAMDFAKSAFGNFTEMSPETRHSLVNSNIQLLQCLDGAYSSLKNFPNESTFMTSYTSFINGDSLNGFFNDCSQEFEREEVVKNFRQNFEVIKSSKSQFSKVKPSIEEYIAIFGLALWNGYTTNMSVDTARIVTRNRKAIILELQSIYSRCGTTGYASRMAQVFGLLANIFRDIQKPLRL